MTKLKKLATGSSVALMGAVLSVPSFAAVDYTSAATSATTEVNAAIAAALPVGIVVMAAVIGWRLFKRFAKG